ncbi:MAG: glycosyltransferase family 2 protein [Lachnospiraceae bacterium]|nr:glycosyltransferase family 2 protein [Lachnospiraceae bacterium]
MQTLRIINFIIALAFTLCYAYQFLYIPVPWFLRKQEPVIRPKAENHHLAVLICARNESAVIGDLIDSLHAQTYPAQYVHIFVMADNCTDDTAAVAAAHGARVYVRHNTELVGKGYALQALLSHLREDFPEGFDAYLVFDADNLLDASYLEEMNRTFCEGHDIITSYRNSKNYGDNWISAGYALWFLRESRYLNHARHLLGTSCAVSGTGFLFSRKVAEEIVDWPYHLLTEDIEFSIDQITKGRKIAFCETAVLYDEQPVSFRQSWHQRMRWSRGYLQVFRNYGLKLLAGIRRGSFSCFDMTMTILPAFILSALSVICNLTLGIWGAVAGEDVMIAVASVAETLRNMYLMLFVLGAITTYTEWSHIRAKAGRKILYLFTFPVFMFTYLPIALVSLFKKTEWKPIRHTVSVQKSGVPLTDLVRRKHAA